MYITGLKMIEDLMIIFDNIIFAFIKNCFILINLEFLNNFFYFIIHIIPKKFFLIFIFIINILFLKN